MCISLVFAIVLSLKLAYIKIQVFGYAHKFFHVGLISKGVPKRLFFAFYAIQGSQKQQPKCVIVSKPLLCTSKLLFELRCLCMFPVVCVCELFNGCIYQRMLVYKVDTFLKRIKMAVLFLIFLDQICPKWIKLDQT